MFNDKKPAADDAGILVLLARDYMREKRARRRWGLFFKFALLAYLSIVLLVWLTRADDFNLAPHTALVELAGTIGGATSTQNAGTVNLGLRRAFGADKAKAVVLRLNSPGGTPVQSAKINEEIIRLRRRYPQKPIYAVITDICASGCYYVAAAADKIYAHRASVVGSIGVRLSGFGFVDAMKKLGVERRALSSGENKNLLDPFLPLNSAARRHAEQVLGEVHAQFINAVKAGRGDKLRDDREIFSGLFWSGEKSRTLGLIDDFGGLRYVAEEVIGARAIVDYSVRISWWRKVSTQLGALLQSLSRLGIF